jgi:hypothetical protein
LREGAKAEFPLLATSGNIDLREGAKAEFPLLATSGDIYLREGAKAEFPLLATSGNIDLREGAKLNIKQLKNLTYKSVDNNLFVVESTKKSKGIKINTGYNVLKIEKGKLLKQPCFVSEKDGFFAHGETVKKSIQDLNFKIIAEKLKKDPIKADTIITVQYYRIITGSCQQGCDNWIKQNNITKTEYKAKDLLPLLEKTNAYGLSKFKELIDW